MARMTLDAFVSQLRTAFGEELRAVVLYGSAAAGEPHARVKNQDVLVLVERLDMSRLNAAGAVVRAWTGAGNPPPFIITADEWRRSADVFPMEYADILDSHRVVYGEPPFGVTRIEPGHLRHELEHEAMGTLLHLRKGVLAAAGDDRRRLELLAVSKGTVLAIFRATLRLHGERPPADNIELCDRIGSVAGVDPVPFKRVAQHVAGSSTLPGRETGEVLTAYVEGVERLVRHLDEYVHSTEDHRQ
jgi:hypothetical protein